MSSRAELSTLAVGIEQFRQELFGYSYACISDSENIVVIVFTCLFYSYAYRIVAVCIFERISDKVYQYLR